MQKTILMISLMLFFSACSKIEPPIAASEKAKLITEQIINNTKCSAFKNKLASPTTDDGEIDKIYEDATKDNCIYKDI